MNINPCRCNGQHTTGYTDRATALPHSVRQEAGVMPAMGCDGGRLIVLWQGPRWLAGRGCGRRPPPGLRPKATGSVGLSKCAPDVHQKNLCLDRSVYLVA